MKTKNYSWITGYLIIAMLKGVILFVQNTYGSIASPYKTYRRLVNSQHYEQLIPLAALVVLYFSWGSTLRVGVRRPFVLAKNWIVATGAAGATLALAVGWIYISARLLKGTGRLKNLVLPWSYSLLPTLAWFYINSFSFFILPPPRHPSLAGKLFSFLFVVGSLALFLWKAILYYLTLRFGMRLDLGRIVIASAIIFPTGVLYALSMYKLGIFRVPFI